jgi:hypothetical protein
MAQSTYIARKGEDADFAALTADSLAINDVLQRGWNLASHVATFDGGTEDARGDHDGDADPATLFTVTGDVLAIVFAKCNTLLEGASATIEAGITGDTAAIIAQTTATDIDEDEIWQDATPETGIATLSARVIVGGADIIETIATANITAGVLTYYCLWSPISADGNVVAA